MKRTRSLTFFIPISHVRYIYDCNLILQHELLYDQQYGFRHNLSTDFALLELSDKIAEAIDKKKFMTGIFVDLSKAFDTLNHNIFVTKMNKFWY